MTMSTDFSAGEPMHDHDHNNARPPGADTDQQPTIQQPAPQVPPAGAAAPPAANGHRPSPGHPPAGQPPMAAWGGEAAPAWGQAAPNGYPQYHQPPVPGYRPPVYGPPPVQPPAPAPQPPPNSQRGLIITLAVLIAVLLLGAGVAVIVLVSGSDDPAQPVTPAAAAAAQPKTVTTIIKQTAPSRSASRRSGGQGPQSTATRSTPSRRRSATPATSPVSSASTDRAEIKSMLRRHFANIQAGNYSSAFADLGSSLGQSQSSWTSDIRSDGLYSYSISVAPQVTSSSSGVANIINFHTEADASGCKDWSGSWNVVKSGGRWLISKSNLSPTVVSCGE